MNVGDYVRTKDGYIGKITKIEQDEKIHYIQKSIYTDNWKNLDMVLEETIVKSSPQIIDLIEKNDLLKIEYRVLPDAIQTEIVQVIENKDKKLFVHLWKGDYFIEDIVKNGMIKQILTHEQFESEAYRVEE